MRVLAVAPERALKLEPEPELWRQAK